MKKIALIALLFTYMAGIPMAISVVDAKASKKPIKKIIKKAISKPKKFSVKFFIPKNPTVSCAMPDGKTIKVNKKDCDFVLAFWAAHKPQAPSNNPSNGGSGGTGSSSNSNNNSQPEKPRPVVTEITELPCTSSSCFGIKTIKVGGTGFTNNTRFELVGSGVTGTYVGGDLSTEILMDFINIPSGTYDVRVFSTNEDTSEVLLTVAITIL